MSVACFEDVTCCVCERSAVEEIRPSRRKTIDPDQLASEFRSSADAPLVDRLVSCRDCGCVFINPRVERSIALAGYSTSPDQTFVSQDKWRILTFKHALKSAMKSTGKLTSVFDIGAGSGAFLAACKDAGMVVDGCEPNVWLTEWARQNYSISIRAVSIDQLTEVNERFDLVTLWDVIEHLADPSEMMFKSRHLMKPDGFLLINYPDYTSAPAKLLGSKWPFWLTAHFWYFSEKTITQFLQRHGFQVIAIRRFWQILSLRYTVFRGLNPFLGTSVAELCSKVVPSALPLNYYLGQKMVIARPKHQGIKAQ